jgi:hypothetical protein
MDAPTLWRCAADIPDEWYSGDRAGLERLVETLCHRRPTIRKLIGEFSQVEPNPISELAGTAREFCRASRSRGRSVEAQRL